MDRENIYDIGGDEDDFINLINNSLFGMEESCFVGIPNKVEALKPIFDEYVFTDLIKACFCISIYRKNRSALENCFSLNQTLFECSRYGKKEIKSYRDFFDFFEKIKGILTITYADDLIPADFGEIRNIAYSHAYKIIGGTGFSNTTVSLMFLESIAGTLKKDEEAKCLLDYCDWIIKKFEDSNPKCEDSSEIVYECPTEQLFGKVSVFFDNDLCDIKIRKASVIMSEMNSEKIEKRHFISFDNHIYPLLNISFMPDIISYWLSLCSTVQVDEIIKTTLYKKMDGLELFRNSMRYIFPAFFIQDELLLHDLHPTAVIVCNKGLIIVVEKSEWERNRDAYQDLQDALDVIENRIRNSSNGKIVVHVESKLNRIFLVYDNYIDIETSHVNKTNHKDKGVFCCTAIDFMNLICFSDNVDEIWEYLVYECSECKPKRISFGGVSNYFFVWKFNDHHIEKGAVKFDIVNTGFNGEIDFVYDHFSNLLSNYPWNLVDKSIFSEPFIWNVVQRDEQGFVEYKLKEYPLHLKVCNFGDKSLGLLTDLRYFLGVKVSDGLDNIETVRPVVEDVIERLTDDLRAIWTFAHDLARYFIEIRFMTKEWYTANPNEHMEKENKYIKCRSSQEDGVITIEYCVNDAFVRDLEKSTDRSTEVEFYLELFSPMKDFAPEFWKRLSNEANTLSHGKKHVSTFGFEVTYYWNAKCSGYQVANECFFIVRKHIAEIALNYEIIPRKYHGKDVNNVIRQIQRECIEDFEGMICEYDQYKIHVMLLEIYSSELHYIMLDRIRYDSMSDLDEKVQEEFHRKTIEKREDEKFNKRVIEFLMESNLFCKRDSNKTPSRENLETLLAYARWLVLLSDNADVCYFCDNEVSIEVTSEWNIDIIGNEDMIKLDNSVIERKYEKGAYKIKQDDEDKKFFNRLCEEFKRDTGFELAEMSDFLRFLKGEYGVDNFVQEYPNIFVVERNRLASLYINIFDVNNAPSRKNIDMVIEFLLIKPEKLKTCSNKADFYIPIGRRKERDNRVEVKCLWEKNGDIIFSTVHCENVFNLWTSGISDFFLPFNVGLVKTATVLAKWKKRYEKQMVFDIEQVFKERGYEKTYHNLDLRKMDKEDHSLELLGDYDVLAIDTKGRKIWMIESKVLSKVGSFFEFYTQQRNFFLTDKEDEHFQRRIDFMKSNYGRVLDYLGLESATYEIVPYMVINKVMTSRYKEVQFEMISFPEFVKIVQND